MCQRPLLIVAGSSLVAALAYAIVTVTLAPSWILFIVAPVGIAIGVVFCGPAAIYIQQKHRTVSYANVSLLSIGIVLLVFGAAYLLGDAEWQRFLVNAMLPRWAEDGPVSLPKLVYIAFALCLSALTGAATFRRWL